MNLLPFFIVAMVFGIIAAVPNACAQAKRPAILTAKLSKHEVVPSEATSLVELLPAGMKPRVLGVDHRVYRIGTYDKDSNKLVNLSPSQYEMVDANTYFTSLPKLLSFSHALDFEIIEKRNGQKFTFSANRLGIFLILAKWHYAGDKGTIESQPVILVVGPPLDKMGRPQVKDEWLKTD